MDLLPRGYHLDPTTWFYLSLLLILAVYFRFHRILSLRNVDLTLLLCASPGLMLVEHESTRVMGFGFLFSVTGIFLVRLLFDQLLKRRPHTTQNLNSAGLAFLCASTFILLSMQSVSVELPLSTQDTQERAGDLIHRIDRSLTDRSQTDGNQTGDVAVMSPVDVETGPTAPVIAVPFGVFENLTLPVMAMAAHLAVIIGLLFIGRNLFGDLHLGTAMATLYMLIPGTAIQVGHFNHVLPAALIVWAFVAYQRPIVSGTLIGLACGTLFFPLFLVPLWAAFYGRRRAGRFLAALSVVFVALLGTYALTSADPDSFWRQTIGTINMPLLAFQAAEGAVSFWGAGDSPFRIPVIAGYFVMLVTITVWPRVKTLEHLIASSAALIVGTQFWYPQQGGVYLLWYLPVLLMVIFRPKLTVAEPQSNAPAIADVKVLPSDRPAPSSQFVSSAPATKLSLYR